MKLRTACAAGIAAAFMAGAAHAATDTDDLTVTATIANVCSVTGGTLAFGTLDQDINNDAQTDISVTCTNEAAYDVGLGDGANSTTEPSFVRRMVNGANQLDYILYTDTGRTAAIGAEAVDNLAADQTGTGSAQTITVYGRVESSAMAAKPAGAYSDTVVITVTY